MSSSNSLVGSTTGTSTTGDQIGLSGITVLSDGSYVVRSKAWDGGTTNGYGAVTWGSGTAGVSGVVSSSNSLVGSHSGDLLGNNVTLLTGNGNYVVYDQNWNSYEGAVTWGSSTSGVSGVVSSANSLVGSTTGTVSTGDRVGLGITALSNGNYVVNSYSWSGGTTNGLGAATWGSGTSGVSGVVSSSNSLVGSHSGDRVGIGTVALSNGNYVVESYYWNTYIGAATWGSGTTGVSGIVSSSNSLVGSTTGTNLTGDDVGANVVALSNGNYVVDSAYWSGGYINGLGASTWGSGTSGVSGVVSSVNSLVGSHSGDLVSGGGFNGLTGNGNYVVVSNDWNTFMGAVTWGSGTSGVSGVISSVNSLVGSTTGTSTTGDQIGRNDTIYALSNGNYVVGGILWNHYAGAMTFGCGSSSNSCGSNGISGVVSSANSLVGSTTGTSSTGDVVGIGGVVKLTGNGNYVVDSYSWNSNTGAVTWGSGTSGVSGVVSSVNSLVGSTTGTSSTGDLVGGGGISASLQR